MDKLDGKIAVITGGSSGIGLATAKEFVREGAYVFITARKQQELDLAVAAIGKNVTAVQGDVANLADLDRLYERVVIEKGRVDIVFANAGIANTMEHLGRITEEKYDLTFNINLRGLLFTVQKALPLMPDGGVFLLCGSTNTEAPNPGFSAYTATKAGVRSFARTWTAELKDRNIRVNVISPGPTDTPIFSKVGLPKETIAKIKAMLVETIPAGRLGYPEEVAKAATFLVSDDSRFIRGVELFVDGGMVSV
jgi:NAD(P)-dependent dehydrogenase (short-subunit alcohol dehydrogenase family)